MTNEEKSKLIADKIVKQSNKEILDYVLDHGYIEEIKDNE